jgi:dephospho-CoA kinase
LAGVKLTVGLTGGIGSGKSTAAAMLASLGAAVIDTDQISRELTAAGGVALGAIREAFGAAVIGAEGALDRAAMRRQAFAEPAVRRRLESLLHPMIRAEAERRLALATEPYAVLVVPLLFESGGYAGRVDRTVVVDVDEALQIERTAARSGLSREEVLAIMAAQWPRWRRLQVADEVLWNGGSTAQLEAQCVRLDARLRAAAR